MENVLEVLNEINHTNSRKEIEDILIRNKNNKSFVKMVVFLLNPYITTGLSSKKISKNIKLKEVDGVVNIRTLEEAMDYIEKNNTGRDIDILNIQRYIANSNKEYQETIKKILTKSLKIKCTGKTINKIFGEGFIPSFDVMLANKYEDHEHKINEFIITEKLDGVRAVIIKENGHISIFSRQGQPIEGLIDIENEAKLFPNNMVYDGELLLLNSTKLNSADLYRATVKEVRKDGIKKNVEFYAFDMLPLNEFQKGVSAKGCLERKRELSDLLKAIRPQWVKLVPMLYVGNDKNVIYKMLDMVEKDEKEGIMVNSVDGKYECKRSSGLLKVKTFKTADVRVIDIIEGTNKNEGKLGAITIQFEHNGELHVCNCGSGFNDEERVLYFNNPELLLNKIVEVGYFEISQNQEGGYGLRFPTWKGIIRHDKDEISMY